mmetsp:Transcript_11742/g.41115  ORF Transcript_11742/g.41115 Transcript_11742/m.41115 type:complete len:259 (+) Transcript_11742:2394-3170(+)
MLFARQLNDGLHARRVAADCSKGQRSVALAVANCHQSLVVAGRAAHFCCVSIPRSAKQGRVGRVLVGRHAALAQRCEPCLLVPRHTLRQVDRLFCRLLPALAGLASTSATRHPSGFLRERVVEGCCARRRKNDESRHQAHPCPPRARRSSCRSTSSAQPVAHCAAATTASAQLHAPPAANALTPQLSLPRERQLRRNLTRSVRRQAPRDAQKGDDYRAHPSREQLRVLNLGGVGRGGRVDHQRRPCSFGQHELTQPHD